MLKLDHCQTTNMHGMTVTHCPLYKKLFLNFKAFFKG